MKKTNGTETLLNMFPYPVFTVENGKITAVNDSAKARQITCGSQIANMISSGKEEYQSFNGGYLSISLSVEGLDYLAGVTRIDESDIFHLYGESKEAELRTMALIAQQMRQPLANIMAELNDLLPTSAIQQNNEMAQKANQINRGVYQLLRRISNLSAMSSFSGNRKYAFTTCNISAFFAEIMERCANLAEKAGKVLEFIPLSADVYSVVDSEMLERSVFNLVSNAIKFSQDGSKITAKLSFVKQKIRFTIQNPCAEDVNLQNLFSRFLREPGLEDSRYGIGLGIPLVRYAAAAHKGSLLMDQPEENTVRFSLTIPICQNHAGTFQSPIRGLDYLGGYDHALVELSDILPPEAFKNI